jgi:hypothetical protein
MPEELELETPVDVDAEVEVQDDPSGEADTTAEPDEPKAPFLSVNERTVYKTQDDAVRGYNEAANRIAQLSAWEKQAKQWGLTDPGQLSDVAKELLELRKSQAAAAKQIETPKVDPKDPKAAEAQQVRDYLKGLGYISKEDQAEAIRELREQIDAMKQSGSRSEELRFQNQEAEAQSDLAGYIATAGVKDDAQGTKVAILGTLIKDWVNNSDERIERWSRGGVSAKALIKEGTDTMIKLLGWKAAQSTGAAPQLKPTDPGYAAAKARAVAANEGKLPAPGTAKGATEKNVPKQRGHINAELHEKAWKLFQEGKE